MALTISKDALLEIVQKAYSLAPTKSSLQILSNVMMTCSGKQLEVVATDLDQSIRCRGDVVGSGTFQVAINARKLFDIVREMPPGEITIEEDEHVLSMVSDKGFSCKVAGTDVADFPAFPAVGDTVDFELDAVMFRRLVAKSSFAVSKDSTRSCLCGVLLEVEPDQVAMVATDGHRLGRCTVDCNTGVKSKVTAIVAPRSLQHVARISESFDAEQRLSVSVGDKYIMLSGPNFMLCSKLIDGPYPDYEKVIPKQNPKTALAERGMLIDAVRRVSVLSSQKTHLVKMHFQADTVEVMVLNRDIGGEARESMPVAYSADPHTIGFNGMYLSEILSIVDTPKARLEMNTQISACLVLPYDEEKQAVVKTDLFLIMPLRLMDEI